MAVTDRIDHLPNFNRSLYMIGYLIWNMIDCRICLYDIKSHSQKTAQLEFTPNLYRFHNPLEMDVSNSNTINLN